MKIIIKTLLLIILLGCLLQMPYGYYQLVRLIVCAGFCWIAFTEYANKQPILAILSILIAALFNPVIKVYFNRDIWHIIDVIIAGLLAIWVIGDLVSLYHVSRQERKRNQ